MNVGPGRRGLLGRVSLARAQRSIVGAGWVVGDQALISASNFFGMVIAARAMSTTEFGTYALAYSAIYALNSLQSSLITQPYSVLAAHRNLEEYRRYTTATGRMQVVMALGIGLPLTVAGLVAIGLGAGPELLALGAALVAWQAQEFMRRVLFFEGRVRAVFGLDVVSFGGQLAAIGLLASAGGLTVSSAFVAAALTSAASALIGLWLLRSTFAADPLPGAMTENLAQGRWLLGAEIGAFICLNGYPFIIAATTGADAVAVYAAAMLILNPLNVIWFAVGNVLPIRLSRARASDGEAAARRELRRFYLASMPFVAAYCLVATILAGPLLGWLFGEDYAAFGWVVGAVSVIRFIGYHSHVLALALRAQHNTRPIFLGYAVAAPFSIVAGIVLTTRLGLAGAILAMLGSTLIWTAVWARAYFRGPVERLPEPPPPDAAEDGRALVLASVDDPPRPHASDGVVS